VVRARPGEQVDLALREAEVIDRSGLPYPCLDTTGLTAAEVLATVRDRWPDCPAGQPGPWPEPMSAAGQILWVCGASAVGKSTVGYEVALSSRRAGHITGFVDLQQIGFLRPAPGPDPDNHRLKAANLAAVWQNFHAYGASRLVVVGSVEQRSELRLYADALRGAAMTLYRLHASPDRLRERIRLRGLGGGPPIAGDELRGRPAAVLERAYEAAVAQADSLERAGIGDVRIDTDDRTVDDLTRQIVRSIGW
jgi:hypothetical protein